jgi:hypothetical protein
MIGRLSAIDRSPAVVLVSVALPYGDYLTYVTFVKYHSFVRLFAGLMVKCGVPAWLGTSSPGGLTR